MADVATFAMDRAIPIAITTALVVYSLARNKLTLDGVVAAVITAGIHMLHPWPVFFYLLVMFFATGTVATRINHAHKAAITQSSVGGVGGEGPRNYAQVLANSATASILILLHLYLMPETQKQTFHATDLLPIGIVASYAAATADTLSSELGILSHASPFLITAPWRRVPRGTNGGVTPLGLIAGFLGAAVISGTAWLGLPFSTASSSLFSSGQAGWTSNSKAVFFLFMSFAGLGGSVLDSVLGAVVQATVEDKRTGRVVEGENGRRVLVEKGGSRVQRGMDLLNNNGVNFAMAAGTALGAMVVAKVVV